MDLDLAKIFGEIFDLNFVEDFGLDFDLDFDFGISGNFVILATDRDFASLKFSNLKFCAL